MKKLLLLMVIVLLAAAPVLKLMRLEVVNKSEYPAFLRLHEVSYDAPGSYHLNVPAAGDLPGLRLFSLVRGLYDVEASYCNQEWSTLFVNLSLDRAQFRIVIPPCEQEQVVDAVVDNSLKLSSWLYPPVDADDVPYIYDLGEGSTSGTKG